jgi:hypothetical protein
MNIQDFDPDRSWLNEPSPNQFIWYIGAENSIREGLELLFANLNKHGHILIEEPIIFDYIDHLQSSEIYSGDVIYVILYKSLSKLEYLEYKLKEKEDNNV